MESVLVPVDGSKGAERAVEHAIALARRCREPLQVHLLYVQIPIASGEVRSFVGHEAIQAYYHDNAAQALKPARELLERGKISYLAESKTGPVAPTIAAYVKDHRCREIVMGTRGMSAIPGLLLGSVATQVVHLAPVPVTLIK